MSGTTACSRKQKSLPPEAAENVVALVRRKLRPTIFGGAFVCSLEWELGRCWPRFVIPAHADPGEFDLRFARGLEFLVIFRPGHSSQHVNAACEALLAQGAKRVVPLQLPRVVES